MIIGLSGYAQSGKDTVANILVEKHGFTRVAFADPLRDLLYSIDPLVSKPDVNGVINYRVQDLVDSYGWDKVKVDFPEVRRLLQDLGLGARELFGNKFWVEQALNKMTDEQNYVISDVRFQNEAEAIVSNGGQMWRITRPNVTAVNRHISETDLDNWEFNQTFINSGTIEDLELTIGTRMRVYA